MHLFSFFSSANSAANFPSPLSFAIHSIVFAHPLAQSTEHVADQRIARLRPAIMHPFAVATCIDQTGSLQAREMPGDFRLDHTERVSQFANARFALGEEIQQAQPRWIGQRLENKSRLARLASFHSIHIRRSVYVSTRATANGGAKPAESLAGRACVNGTARAYRSGTTPQNINWTRPAPFGGHGVANHA